MTALSYTEPIIAAVLFLLAATFMTQMSPVPQLDVPGSLNKIFPYYLQLDRVLGEVGCRLLTETIIHFFLILYS